jgi:hypothetical protein
MAPRYVPLIISTLGALPFIEQLVDVKWKTCGKRKILHSFFSGRHENLYLGEINLLFGVPQIIVLLHVQPCLP